jgi:hypothetical protein
MRTKLLMALAGGAPRLKLLQDKQKLALDHPNELEGQILLMRALGTTDLDFLNGILNQVGNAGGRGPDIDLAGINFMLSIVKGIAPRDQVEAMLAAQMAAIHVAMMRFARQLTHVETLPQQDSAERTLNKLARTYATQMEALKRYRTGGEQKVTVQHVSVSEGGQAIVGNVTQGQPDAKVRKGAVSPPALTHTKTPPMPIIDECQEPAPVPARRVRKK